MAVKSREEGTGKFLASYNAKTLLEKGEEYFETVDVKSQSVFGLCIYLGITKTTYYRYLESEDKEMQEAANWLATRLGAKYEADLAGKMNNPTGPIFMLKQKPFGFGDKQEVDLKGNGTFNIISNIPRPEEK